MMDITFVPVGAVAGVIPALLPYLQESAERSRGRATVDDILRMVLNGQMQLWVVYEGNTIYGHVITEEKQYPRCKMLVCQYCAGEPNHMHYVEDKMYAILEDVAQKAGCAGVEFVGRPGWKKSATEHGFDVQSVVFQKFFEVTE